jgi:tRNA nucleotidyltransferase (CCA-adding enzyme)
MPDYVYLLENRLSSDQQHALRVLRDASRDAGLIVFLTGEAVRDLTSGHAVRELEVAVHGNALKLKKAIEKGGGKIWGEDEASRSLYLCFPGTVRVDLVSTHWVEYKKPGQPTYHWASIQEDLRRRDFTANAMAISLNEGSYGLLMDPLNGVADIEARSLRLVSSYGFIEDPALLIRAVRYRTRLVWELDPRTQQRYENAKSEGTIEYLSSKAKSRELEQIGHEDDGLGVLKALEAEGWMKVLCPAWTHAKADTEKLKALHDLAVDLLMQGVHADISAAQMQLLTAKMQPKDLASLKKQLLRPGFVQEWNSLDSLAAGFQKVLLSRQNHSASATFKLFTTYDPESILWLGFTSKDAAVKEKYHNFLKVWPEMRQRIPYALMQEMRIRPELPNYNEIVHAIFLQLIDGKLVTPEEMRAFLEPYSPPAPPPQQTYKRSRPRRGAESKIKESFEEEEGEEGAEEEMEDLPVGDEDEIGLGMPKIALEPEEEGEEEEEEEEEEEAVPSKKGKAAAATKAAAAKAPAKGAPKPAEKPAPHPAAQKPAAKPAAKPEVPAKVAAKPAPAKPAPEAKKAPPKPAPEPPKKTVKPAVKAAALKPAAKPAHKSVPKKPAKAPAAKAAVKAAKPAPKKPAAKKPAPKPAPKPKPKPHKPSKPAAKKPAAKAAKKK